MTNDAPAAISMSGTVGSILATSFRQILHELGINTERYSALMDRYIARQMSTSATKIDHASSYATLSRELLKDTITWKTYLRGFLFLSVKRFDFRIEGRSSLAPDPEQLLSGSVSVDMSTKKSGVSTGTYLADILRQLYAAASLDSELNKLRYQEVLGEYLKKIYLTMTTEDDGTRYSRASLSRELLKSSITWKVFVKGLVVAEIFQFTLAVSLTHANGLITHHHLHVNIDGITSKELAS